MLIALEIELHMYIYIDYDFLMSLLGNDMHYMNVGI